MSVVVIRTSSLGDVVLAGAVTAALPGVVFRTQAAWAPVAERLSGVARVEVVGRDPLGDHERIVDLQNNLRSRRETVGRTGVSRVRRYDVRRRMRVWWKVGAPPPLVIARYAAVAGVEPAPTPWIDLPGPRDATLLVPGAAWATKRWPVERWVGLGRALPGPVVVLGGPDDGHLVGAVARGIGPRAEALWERGFARTFAAIGRGRVAVAGDTGLMHLCAAAGVPVVGLFGPTTAADGFWCHRGAVVERALPCRPCSRHGSPVCPMGDHACLAELPVARVRAAIAGLS